MRPQDQSRNLNLFNNAVQFQSPNAVFLDDKTWHQSYRFMNNLSSRPLPPILLEKEEFKDNLCADPLFRNPSEGDFRLKPQSSGIDAGRKVDIEINTGTHRWTTKFQGKAPDIGAYEGDVIFEGPPYQRIENGTPHIEGWEEIMLDSLIPLTER